MNIEPHIHYGNNKTNSVQGGTIKTLYYLKLIKRTFLFWSYLFSLKNWPTLFSFIYHR